MSVFSYGFAPSVFMWKKDGSPVSQDDTSDDQGGGITDAVTSILDPADASSTADTFLMYKFDAVPSEGHTSQAIVTKFPMSNGFLVSDHLIKQNRILKLKVVAANMVNNEFYDLTLAGGVSVAADVLAAPLIGIIGQAGTLVQSAFTSDDRVANAFKIFNQLMANGTRIYVNTILGVYANCVVTGIETIQEKDTSTILAAELTLEELQVVTESDEDKSARKVLSNMTDYSKFVKMGSSVGLFALKSIL